MLILRILKCDQHTAGFCVKDNCLKVHDSCIIMSYIILRAFLSYALVCSRAYVQIPPKFSDFFGKVKEKR